MRDHRLEVREVVAQRLPEPAVRLIDDVARRTDAAPREVEGHGGAPGEGEALGEAGEEAPVLEPLEAVADDDGRPPFTGPGARSDVYVEGAAVGPGEPQIG